MAEEYSEFEAVAEAMPVRRIRIKIDQFASGKYKAENTVEVSGALSYEELDDDLMRCLIIADERARFEVARREARDAGTEPSGLDEAVFGVAAARGFPVEVAVSGKVAAADLAAQAEPEQEGLDDIPF